MDQRTYWDEFYASNRIEEPSDFAMWVGGQSQFIGTHLVDWGCGSGRDGLYLAKYMERVTLIDNSEIAIQSVNQRIMFEHISNAKGFVEDIREQESMAGSVNQTVVHYARFFLHAIDDQALLNFINLISRFGQSKNMRRAAFEYRIEDLDSNLEYVYGNHERWLRSPEFVTSLMRDAGWQLENEIIGRDLAVFREERPLVARQFFLS